MNIMIDYDGTFGADPMMFQDVIEMFQGHHHKVYLVTSRGMDTPVEHAYWFADHYVPIVYCNYRAKREVCEEQGIKIDIWIDDAPYYIDHGFVEEYTAEQIKEYQNKFNGGVA